jgi:glucose-1-phosphate cytidylyltransferase
MNKDIPVVILAGGTGTRLKEQTEFRPKGMIEIGGHPMLWHIIQWYRKFGFCKFVLALGYKQEIIKQYFANYDLINSDVTIDIGRYRGIKYHGGNHNTWSITLVNTGENTLKGGRLNRIKDYTEDQLFCLSYGDGLSNIDLNELIAFHKSHKKTATMTGVYSPPRFGEITKKDTTVISFSEKPLDTNNLINAGYFVFDQRIFHYLDNDCDLEIGALERVVQDNEMQVYHHKGYWGCIDTLSDMNKMQKIWESGKADWRV